MYKFLIDENIPFALEAFSELGTVKLCSGRDINNISLKSTDILIIRSITKVNQELLRGTPVKFVGTTTIGSDHIDIQYLKKNNIGFANAPGCNADSVAEYVFAALLNSATVAGFSLENKSIGIIGLGNIGSRVARIALGFGMSILINDPPLQRKTREPFFITYNEALQADIITFHVPLNLTGADKTYHMLSESQLKKFDNGKIILNASRGSVVSNNDLKNFLNRQKNKVVLDVWENEPNIDLELLNLVQTGTAHIAGYSLEGKVNGTTMIFNSLCKFLNVKKEWKPGMPEIEKAVIKYPEADTLEESINLIISKIYKINSDDKKLREINRLNEEDRGKYFDQLRKKYSVRREFANYTIRINKKLQKEIRILKALRFNVKIY